TSTRNMTGLRIMERGSSMANERQVAMRTSAGSNTPSRRAWRRWSFRAWASAAALAGISTWVSTLIDGSPEGQASAWQDLNDRLKPDHHLELLLGPCHHRVGGVGPMAGR